MKPKQIFDIGLQYHHYANTAYPLTPSSFKNFRVNKQSDFFPFLEKEWAKTNELSLYVHIPFCKTRCRFCEYVVLDKIDVNTEELYVSLLQKEIEMYKPIINSKKIIGYDMGGGTPSKLSTNNLYKITETLTSNYKFDKNAVFSIETTPAIAASELQKITDIFDMGYKRISMGIQTISEKLLNELGREGTTHVYEKAVENIRKAGFSKFNIDLMYGFLYQNDEDFISTLKYAIALNPEYITLYRNRYKGTKLENEAGGVSLYKIINQYRLAYNILIENGYYANIGKNTFSRINNDYGTSDYLTKRVIDGVSYIGFGLGAQSFGIDYLAYNEGAASKLLDKYKQKLDNNQIPIQDLYALEKEETIAKMVSVAFYFGFIDFLSFQRRFNVSFTEHFKEEIDFVINEGLMEIKDNRIWLTNRGADYINGIIPLFYSQRSKQELFQLYFKNNTNSNGEKQFLKSYNINEFQRPSLATDIVVLIKKQTSAKSVVMIKRGEHPFMNFWALPGGFVKPNETAEQTAIRELYEETGIENVSLKQIQLFSEPNRDPRGWIVSCAFVTFVDYENINVKFGDDAIDVKIFDISVDSNVLENKNKVFEIKLSSEDIELTAKVEKVEISPKQFAYNIVESEGIAFDHAKIILMAMDC